MVYSHKGEDRKHHPEVCVREAAGKPEDVSARATLALDAERPERFYDQNYYWLNVMGRLRPGVRLADAQAALATPFEQWVRSTAETSAELANSSVWPSGGAAAAALEPMVVPPPGLLSTITVWPSFSCSGPEITRAAASEAPPGGKVTTILTARCGHGACAPAGAETNLIALSYSLSTG